jgi:hypothetical protein
MPVNMRAPLLPQRLPKAPATGWQAGAIRHKSATTGAQHGKSAAA